MSAREVAGNVAAGYEVLYSKELVFNVDGSKGVVDDKAVDDKAVDD